MNLNDTKVVVAIENAVCDQLEASGIKADPFRLDGEKIVQVILEQLGDYVVVPKEPTEAMLRAANDHVMNTHATPFSAYKVMIEAVQE
ncbi:hypothetical protein [Acinetobacter sp. ANC 5045]|uniref:hypothetical protein n=1 Tax=Acinetobacter sp. ANC 5045 TaxID=2529851 RepID=UPI00103DE98D|nr:hypothetical protein [Acinetobacter sp. ANC 5045]TCB17350.1 hypothetical protein E0H79_08895 [Acinetobacter sp. ANC 5045]